MPRSKPRKSTKGQFSPEAMKAALLLVRNGCKPKAAAKSMNLAYSTVKRYLIKTQDAENLENVQLSPSYATRQVFSSNLENALVDYILECSKMKYGLTALEIRKFAFEYAVANNVKFPNAWDTNRQAGEDWFQGFMRRHKNLSARKPEQCSVARAMAFNKPNIMNFFGKLEDVLRRHPNFANGSRIYNLDETGTSTVGEMKRLKVIGEKGCKQLHQIKSAERGVLVTTCCIVCANGTIVPPVMVFPRVNFTNSMIINAYPGTKGLATKKGWMNSAIFPDVLRHFINQTNSSIQNPALLIVDSLTSHLTFEAIELCRQHGVTLFTLPPHTTHKTQPLDVGVFGPFQTAYSRAYNSWILNHPGEICTIYHVAGLVNEALCKAATPSNIFSAFKATGIFPFNKDIFSDLDFVPSKVTENPQPVEDVIPSVVEDGTQESLNEENEDDPAPGPSVSNITTPRKVRPLPKAKPKNVHQKPREKGKCRVATDSAEKNEIKEKHEANKRKEEEQQNKRKEKARKSLETLLELNVSGKGKKRGQNHLIADLLKTNARKRSMPLKNKKAPKKSKKLEETSSESESEIHELSDSNSSDEISENYEEEEKEDAGNSGDCVFLQLLKSPEEGEHVLVQFEAGKEKKYYVAKVLKTEDEDGDLEVSYYRASGKVSDKFVLPNIPDLKSVHVSNIKTVLPNPTYGATARQKNLMSFNFDFSNLRMG